MPLNDVQKANITEYFNQNSLIPEEILQCTAEEKKAFAKRYLTVIKGAYDEELITFCYLWHIPGNSRFDEIYNIELSDLRHFTLNYIEAKLGAPKFYGLFHSKEITMDNGYMEMSPELKHIYEAIYLGKMNESMLKQSFRHFSAILILSARFGRVKLLKRLLDLGEVLRKIRAGIPLYESKNSGHMSLLQIVTEREHTKCLNLLLKCGANPDNHFEGTESPLKTAINSGNLLSVCALIKYKATITVDMINFAMETNRLDIALILIKKAPQKLIAQTSSKGTTMLSRCLALFCLGYVQQQQAVLEGLITKIPNSTDPISLLTCILKRGANTNERTEPPLKTAIMIGNGLSVCALIKYKATITVDMINFAMETNRLDIAFILIKQVSKLLIDKTSSDGITMLLRCLTLFCQDVVQQQAALEGVITKIPNATDPISLLTCILERGANTNVKSCGSIIPLDFSISETDDVVTKLLIDHDAQFNQQHIVDLIKGDKNPQTTRLMIEKSSTDFLDSATERTGELILNIAVICSNIDVVKQLIAKGVNPELKDKKGFDSFRIAIDKKNVNITKILHDAQDSNNPKTTQKTSPTLKP